MATMEDARAQSQIDHLGSGELATGLGIRLLSIAASSTTLFLSLRFWVAALYGWSSMGV